MLLVKSIEVEEVPGNVVAINHVEGLDDMPFALNFADKIPHAEISATKETIQGQMFTKINGERVCIGWSNQVQDVIGLPLEAFENLRNEIKALNSIMSQLRRKSDGYQKRLEKIQKSSLNKCPTR